MADVKRVIKEKNEIKNEEVWSSMHSKRIFYKVSLVFIYIT